MLDFTASVFLPSLSISSSIAHLSQAMGYIKQIDQSSAQL